MHFIQKPGVMLHISVEISARSPSGFDGDIQRAVRENGAQLFF